MSTSLSSDNHAPVAQLDRVIGYEPIGQEFESLRVRHSSRAFAQSWTPRSQSPLNKQILLNAIIASWVFAICLSAIF